MCEEVEVRLPNEGEKVYFGTITDIKEGHKGRFAVIVAPPDFTEENNATGSVESPSWLSDGVKARGGMGVVFWNLEQHKGKRGGGWRTYCLCKHTPDWKEQCRITLEKRQKKPETRSEKPETRNQKGR